MQIEFLWGILLENVYFEDREGDGSMMLRRVLGR
jgi:hypothetical protein